MKKLLLSMTLFVATMMTAFAQITTVTYGGEEYKVEATQTLNIEETYGVAYQGSTADFSAQLAALCQAIGTDSPTPAQLVQVDPTGAGFVYNQNDGWHGADGMIEGKTWGSEEKLVCIKPWNIVEDADVIDGTISYIGCIDELWEKDEVHTFYVAVINAGKAGLLEIKITFSKEQEIVPEPEVGEITTKLADLTIVKEYNGTLDLVLGKQYEGKTLDLPVEGICEALGLTEEDLSVSAELRVYAEIGEKIVNAETDQYHFDIKADLVQPRGDGATDGWFGYTSVYDEDKGEEIIDNHNVLLPYGTNSTFYLQNYTYAEGVFTIGSCGQYPGALKEGSTYSADLYVINGNKAVKITIAPNVVKPESIPFEEMEKAGETTIEITDIPKADYSGKSFNIDMEAIAETLGCEVADLDVAYTWRGEDDLTNDPTANNGGYWFNEDGYAVSWGNGNAFFMEPATNGDFSTWNFGQNPNKFEGGEVLKADLLFMANGKYYVVHVQNTINAGGDKPEDFVYNRVATEEIAIQIVPSADTYEWGTKTTLDVDYIADLIKTSNFVVYTDKVTTGDDGNKWAWSNSNTMGHGEAGFWYGADTYENDEHQVVVSNAGWGSNSFGIEYQSGVITWYQFPGQRSIGDSYQANLYFANDETGDYVQYILHVDYVETVGDDIKTVGTEKVFLEYNEGAMTFDFAKMFEALELEPELIESAKIVAPKSALTFSEIILDNGEATIYYNAKGYATDVAEDIVYIATLTLDETGHPNLMLDIINDDDALLSDAPATATFRIGIEYDGKRYVHEITVINHAAVVDGVDSIAAATKVAKGVYTIAGQKVNAATAPGLYIIDGKKTLVK